MAGKTSATKSGGKDKAGDKKQSEGKPRGGLAKPVKPDAKLAAVVGKDPLPRSELTKKIWDYVKSNNLQDEKNRRMINADDKLRPIFNGQNQVSMFEMTKLVNQHVS